MTVCNYIDTLYDQILNSYNGTPIDYTVLDESITGELIILVNNPTTDNTYTSSCALDIIRNACDINIQIL